MSVQAGALNVSESVMHHKGPCSEIEIPGSDETLRQILEHLAHCGYDISSIKLLQNSPTDTSWCGLSAIPKLSSNHIQKDCKVFLSFLFIELLTTAFMIIEMSKECFCFIEKWMDMV